MIYLEEIAEVFNGKTPSKSEQRENGEPILKIKNTSSSGEFLGFDSWVDNDFSKRYKSKKLREGDTLFLNAAHNASHVGSKYFYATTQVEGVLATGEWLIIRPRTQNLDSKFKHYFLTSDQGIFQIRNLVKGIHLYPKDVKRIKIPLPPLPIQQKIAEVLDTADRIRRRNQQVLEKYDQLAQSVFLEMFGDFSHKSGRLISDYAEIVSGVTKDSKINGEDTVEVPYMRVANVQDGFIDLDEIKLIRVKLRDVSRFRLLKGDILLTEGGDPDKLGRGAVWQYEIENCIHQNHIFRVRLDEKELNPIYTSYLLGSSYGKKYFLKAAKQTTGIASINITQLKKFPIIVPPLALQNQFESIIEKMEQQKQQAKAELDKSEELFQSLMQRAFPQADKVGGS